MPANLPPDYFAAEKRFREAKSTEEKIAILEEMMSIMPKHKGTDKIYGELKRKMAKLKESKEKEAKKGGRREHWMVKKEGAGQVVLVGPPNSGKSALLHALTHAHPEVAEYPFTTRMPVPGMMPFEDIQIQLVELPALTAEVMESWLPNAIYMADFLAVVLDLSANTLLDDVDAIFKQIEAKRIKIVPDIPKKAEPGYRYIRSMIIGNKRDIEGAKENVEILKEWLNTPLTPSLSPRGEGVSVVTCSAENFETCKMIPGEIFKAMKLIRVYPKKPGTKCEKEDPLVLPEGSTVIEAAEHLHRDIAEKLKFARGWGEGIYDGQHLARDFILQDGFIVEFH